MEACAFPADFQIIVVMPHIYEVPLPKEYFELMGYLHWVSLDWLELGLKPACVGDFEFRLRVQGFAPLVVLAALVVGVVVLAIGKAVIRRECAASPPGDSPADPADPVAREPWFSTAFEAARQGMLSALPLALAFLFTAVPFVSSRIFMTFSCTPCE